MSVSDVREGIGLMAAIPVGVDRSPGPPPLLAALPCLGPSRPFRYPFLVGGGSVRDE